MKTILSLFLAVCLALPLFSQPVQISNPWRIPDSPAANYPHRHISGYLKMNETRLPLYLPEIEGYTLLKCDFHLHTVFSDGSVWPATRVEEAFMEGLDAIAITDHIEIRGYVKDIKAIATENYSREYEIAKIEGDRMGIMVIPGLEVSSALPAGHFNLLFINDGGQLMQHFNPDNLGDPSKIADILSAGKAMGAFIVRNHPWDNQGIALWAPIHQELFEKKLFMGMEIINSGFHIPMSHQWCDDKGLTKMSGTDSHEHFKLPTGIYRDMTIVFARDRSVEGIREALFAGRTVGYSHNYLYGAEDLLKPIFSNSLKTRVLRSTEKDIAVEIRNLSGLPFEIEISDGQPLVGDFYGKFTLYGNQTVAVTLYKSNPDSQSKEVEVVVNNLHVKADTPLKTVINF